MVSEEGEVRFGRILAADLTVNGRAQTAFRFEGPDGKASYYDVDGQSLKRAFLRAPLQFRRISSSFNRSRRHPILGFARQHQGTDYAADYGTPVLAAGDGMVAQAGRSGGYGNLIEIRHANGIITRYGHLERHPGPPGQPRLAGPGHRPGRRHRTGHRVAPALRVSGQRGRARLPPARPRERPARRVRRPARVRGRAGPADGAALSHRRPAARPIRPLSASSPAPVPPNPPAGRRVGSRRTPCSTSS